MPLGCRYLFQIQQSDQGFCVISPQHSAAREPSENNHMAMRPLTPSALCFIKCRVWHYQAVTLLISGYWCVSEETGLDLCVWMNKQGENADLFLIKPSETLQLIWVRCTWWYMNVNFDFFVCVCVFSDGRDALQQSGCRSWSQKNIKAQRAGKEHVWCHTSTSVTQVYELRTGFI